MNYREFLKETRPRRTRLSKPDKIQKYVQDALNNKSVLYNTMQYYIREEHYPEQVAEKMDYTEEEAKKHIEISIMFYIIKVSLSA